uniref:Lectin 5 n=1 Tax=Lonomia obliqua TaxID=304329 RepID=Q5MGE0_LONON|nr:lectin 5 [Lonomia obliqua]
MSVLFVFLLLVACVQCKAPDGYTVNVADGYAYKLMYVAQPWDDAREQCLADGAKLAVPQSPEQFAFMQEIVHKMHFPSVVGSEYKHLVWLGIDSQKGNVWKNLDGVDINQTGYHKWATGNGKIFSSDDREPHCVGLDSTNEGLRDFWCKHKQPYLCEVKTTA